MKKINLENVLKTILLHGPISRAKIASLTGLNKVTVSHCVDYFIEKKVIHELGTTGTNRGRPPTLIDINGNAGIMVGFDTDIYMCRVLVTDLSGQRLEQMTLSIQGPEPELFIELISNVISNIKGKYRHYPLGIVGVGLALPGHYNYQTGLIEFVANQKSWNGFPVRNEINKLNLGMPFFIETIANAGAIGEIHFGKSSVSEHLVYISSFWGLGVGICMNGKIYSGYSGFAGRLGHSTIHINGKKCTCGNRGCWEAYASVRALYEQLYPGKQIRLETFNEIIERFRNRDPEVVSVMHELTQYLAYGMVNVINAYNPSEICIGGYLSMLDPNLGEKLKNILVDMMPKHFLTNLNIYCSELGELGVAYGAISMVKDHLPEIFIDSNHTIQSDN